MTSAHEEPRPSNLAPDERFRFETVDRACTLRVEREDGELLVLDRLHTTAPESMAAATSATVGEGARRALGGSKGATPGSSSR